MPGTFEPSFRGTAFALVLLVLPSISLAANGSAENPVPTGMAPADATHPDTLTSSEAERALEVLQDDAKRGQLIDTLRAIAATSRDAPSAAASVPAASPATPVSPPAAARPAGALGGSIPASAPPAASPQPDSDDSLLGNGLGAELLSEVSDSIGDMSHELASAARTVTNFPLLWHWLVETGKDPYARDTLLGIAWRLILVIGCALLAEWVMSRAVQRPRLLLEKHVPPRARDQAQETQESDAADLAALQHADPELKIRSGRLDRFWRFLLRLPFVGLGLLLDLLPVVAFAITGNLLLMTELGDDSTPRLVILAIVNAYVICRVVMCVARALVSPNGLSMLTIRGETAAYIEIWVRRLVTFTVFGIALANVALLLGLYRPAYLALIKLVMLTVHLLLVIVTLQCRQAVAEVIRAPAGARGIIAVVRNRVADVWHYVAIFLNLAVWAIWALRIRNGYELLLQYVLATVTVLVIARLASILLLGSLDRLFRINPEFIRRFPGLEARANKYYPLLRGTISTLVGVAAAIALLQVWGVPAAEWLYGSEIGGRLMSAIVTIAIVGLLALAGWEASNAAIDRHLVRLTREARYVRAARLRTFLPILRTTLLCVILAMVGLTVLSEVGVNIAPLLAGAGIIGIAIGFGSQKLVQDFITGLFLLFENAMQVGDVVTVSGLTGTVEHLSIRTIRLRAGDGSVHIIPFSAVTSVTNTNRGVGNASVSVNVAYREDTDRVGEVLKAIAAELREDPHFKHLIRGDLELWGVDKVDGAMVTMVGQIPCTDTGRWPVQREFNRRMKRRFQDLGIEIAPAAQTTLLVEPDSSLPVKIEPAGRARRLG